MENLQSPHREARLGAEFMSLLSVTFRFSFMPSLETVFVTTVR